LAYDALAGSFSHHPPCLSFLGGGATVNSGAKCSLAPSHLFTSAHLQSEWVNQSLASKGIVLVKIDPKTGVVTGTGMLQSTGSKLLDRAALKAYSKWRFKPGSVPQIKMPIEFASRPRPQPSKQAQKQPAILYVLLILLGFGAAATALRKRKTST
jgi:TonB family protein